MSYKLYVLRKQETGYADIFVYINPVDLGIM